MVPVVAISSSGLFSVPSCHFAPARKRVSLPLFLGRLQKVTRKHFLWGLGFGLKKEVPNGM